MLNTGIDARRALIALVLVSLGVAFSGGLLAGTDQRAQMVRDIYQEFISHGMWCDKAKMSKYFAADMVKDAIRACEADEYPPYMIIPGNDFDGDEIMRTLKVAPGSGSTYKASFRSFGEANTVTYTFEKQGRKWRITSVD